jgi:lysophospholipase L1-like esterase
MVVNRLRDQIHTMLGFEDPPKFLILHVGGNDLSYKKVGHLRKEIKQKNECILNQRTSNYPNLFRST